MTSRSASWRGHPDRSKALYSHRHPRYAKERRPSSRSSIARVRSLENWSRQMTRQQRRLRQSSNRLSDNHHRLVAATESGPSPDIQKATLFLCELQASQKEEKKKTVDLLADSPRCDRLIGSAAQKPVPSTDLNLGLLSLPCRRSLSTPPADCSIFHRNFLLR